MADTASHGVALRRLFTPGRIGQVPIKNRIVKAPQTTGLSNLDGTVSERTIRHYRRLAEGGAGLVVVEYTYVDDDASKSAHCQLGVSRADHISGLGWLADTIHAGGARAALQIEHCGRQKLLGTRPIKAPSALPWPSLYERTGLVPEVLTLPEIAGIVSAFGDAARRAWQAGFDLVEIHGAHGYLITGFLSPHTNKRADLYGGPLDNRMRFLLDVIADVRDKVPASFPVMVRLSASDYEPDGITVAETIQVCRALEAAGVDAIGVSGGDHHTIQWQVSPELVPRGVHADAAGQIRSAVDLPVIVSGSITTPDLAEELLARGASDFVALGRPLLADPDWPRKAEARRFRDIRPCIRCNEGCLERGLHKQRAVGCSVNPTVGREDLIERTYPTRARRVAVVGGGPAGMEAATLLAAQGHAVRLHVRGELGGGLRVAATPAFKGDVARLLDHLRAQVEGASIEVAGAATPASGADVEVVVVATGARPRPLAVPGADRPEVLSFAEAILGGVGAGPATVAVVGGGPAGVQAALHLRAAGHRVTLVEQGDQVLAGRSRGEVVTYTEALEEAGVEVLLGGAVVAVVDGGVTVAARRGSTSIPADRVVVAVGRVVDDSLAQAYREQGIEVHVIGSARALGTVHDAIHEAHALVGVVAGGPSQRVGTSPVPLGGS